MASIEIVKHKNGSKSYRITYYLNGIRQPRINFPKGTSYKVVRSRYLELESHLFDHKSRIKELTVPSLNQKLTIQEFKEWFKEQRVKYIAKSTLDRYLLAIDVFANVVGHNTLLAKISTEHIENFKDNQFSAGKTRAGINKDLHNLKVALNYAKKKKLIIQDIEIEKFNNIIDKEPDYLEPHEMNKLMSEIRGEQHRLACEIVKWTGIRRSELLLRCKKSDINFKDNYIKIKGKNNKEDRVPLHPELAKYLTKNKYFNSRECDELIFTKSVASLTREIKRAKERAGLSHKRGSVHIFRHSLGTNLLNAHYENDIDIAKIEELFLVGKTKQAIKLLKAVIESNKNFDLRDVQKILRHKTLFMTTKYAQILEKRLKSKFSKFNYK